MLQSLPSKAYSLLRRLFGAGKLIAVFVKISLDPVSSELDTVCQLIFLTINFNNIIKQTPNFLHLTFNLGFSTIMLYKFISSSVGL